MRRVPQSTHKATNRLQMTPYLLFLIAGYAFAAYIWLKTRRK
jgi:hypothetical protein